MEDWRQLEDGNVIVSLGHWVINPLEIVSQ